MPPDLMAAFAAAAEAKRFFDTLTPSQKQWYVLPIEQAKAVETRERRIAKALALLREPQALSDGERARARGRGRRARRSRCGGRARGAR